MIHSHKGNIFKVFSSVVGINLPDSRWGQYATEWESSNSNYYANLGTKSVANPPSNDLGAKVAVEKGSKDAVSESFVKVELSTTLKPLLSLAGKANIIIT